MPRKRRATGLQAFGSKQFAATNSSAAKGKIQCKFVLECVVCVSLAAKIVQYGHKSSTVFNYAIYQEINLTQKLVYKFFARVFIAMFCMATFSWCVCTAFADENDTRVAQSAKAYNEAVANQEKIANDISSLNSRITKIEKKLPKQQSMCNESLCAMYKNSSDNMTIVSALLNAQSITDVLSLVDAYNWIYEYNEEEVKKTIALKDELENSKAELEQRKKEADDAAAQAASDLEAAKQARKEAQQKALEAQKKENAKSSTKSSSTKSSHKTPAKAKKSVSADNVSWDSDKKAFVKKWAPRINAYLAGSPTAGTGTYYAQYAWDYGVDPRWAPAISFVESSKGAVCFRSYNAWGFGSSGFSSWKEGIQTVCAALGGSLYGGYLTEEAAKTYCPPTWQSWYKKCATEMSKI